MAECLFWTGFRTQVLNIYMYLFIFNTSMRKPVQNTHSAIAKQKQK